MAGNLSSCTSAPVLRDTSRPVDSDTLPVVDTAVPENPIPPQSSTSIPLVSPFPTPTPITTSVDLPGLTPRPEGTVVATTSAPVIEKVPTVSALRTLEKPTASATPARPFDRKDVFIHLPPNATAHQPLRVLVALHGMGGQGSTFAKDLVQESDRNHWILVAPTITYHDWKNPTELLKDDLEYTRMLRATLDDLPNQLGLRIHQHILLFGFSRGAQLAHRFALFYPDHVESVAALSAGTYTLPEEKKVSGSNPQLLPLPYGVGDLVQRIGKSCDFTKLKKVSFWLAVGAKDNRVDDVPRQFDSFVGKTRIERAKAFHAALIALGIDSHLIVFPNTDHEITNEMLRTGLQFLHDDEAADGLND